MLIWLAIDICWVLCLYGSALQKNDIFSKNYLHVGQAKEPI